MIPFYDAHNHLQDERLAGRIEEVLAELPSLGLQRCVVNGTCERDWPSVAALASRFSWIIPAFGLHPWFASERSPLWFDTLRGFLDSTPRGCIGEIGLDRWMRDSNVADQENIFVTQLELAAERNLAVSIHCLKAWGHLEELLKTRYRPARGFLIHSYGGSAEMIPSFESLGAYFSLSGYFAHDRKAAQRDAFKKIPIDRLLVETDAPDMLPPSQLIAKETGELNDPRNLPRIYAYAADLFAMPLPKFAEQMQRNFEKLFLSLALSQPSR